MTKERTGTVSPSTGQQRGPATQGPSGETGIFRAVAPASPQLFPGTTKRPKTQLCSVRTSASLASSLSGISTLESHCLHSSQAPRVQSPQPHKITWGSSGFSAFWQLPLPSSQERGQCRRETHLFKLPSALRAPGWRSSPLSRCLESSAGLVCCEQLHSQKQSVCYLECVIEVDSWRLWWVTRQAGLTSRLCVDISELKTQEKCKPTRDDHKETRPHSLSNQVSGTKDLCILFET